MKRIVAGFAVALTLALSASAAMADGMDRRGGPPCCAAGWTGFYIGAGVGGGVIVHQVDTGPTEFDGGAEGFFGTVTVGYDRQINSRWVAGIFADYDFASNMTRDLSLFGGAFLSSLEHKSTWSIGGRAGILTSPTTLWYASTGYSWSDFDLNATTSSLEIDSVGGWFVGAGVESQLGKGWSLRGEYRYTMYDDDTLATIGVSTLEFDNAHTARLSLSYKFGRREEARPLK